MDFSLGTRALSLLQFTVYANESLSILCRPLWLEIRMAQGRRRAVRVRSTPSGQNAFWSGSPHFTYIWYLYLVFFSTFFTFFLFRSCFGPSKRATHATHGTNCVPNTLCTGPLTQFPVVPVPADSTLQLQLQALFHYEHAHSRTRKYAHTSPYLFISEWTNTRQKCVWNFKCNLFISFLTGQQYF